MDGQDESEPLRDPSQYGFAWDIAIALRKVTLYRARGKAMTLEDKLLLGQTILEHFRMSGVLLARKPPLDGHTPRGAPAQKCNQPETPPLTLTEGLPHVRTN